MAKIVASRGTSGGMLTGTRGGRYHLSATGTRVYAELKPREPRAELPAMAAGERQGYRMTPKTKKLLVQLDKAAAKGAGLRNLGDAATTERMLGHGFVEKVPKGYRLTDAGRQALVKAGHTPLSGGTTNTSKPAPPAPPKPPPPKPPVVTPAKPVAPTPTPPSKPEPPPPPRPPPEEKKPR